MFARTAGGDWQTPLKVVTDVGTCSAQKATDIFNLWQGAWIFNNIEGFPWLQQVLGRRANSTTLANFRALVRSALALVPAVIPGGIQVTASVHPTSRQLVSAFRAPLNNGQVLEGGAGGPVIVTGNANS